MKDKMKLLPLLFFYIAAVLLFSTNNFWGDEGRYVMYATNLSHGYYSPPDDIYLWSGPGYPIILLPFVLLKLPWLTAKLLNALFLFIAVLYFYSTLRIYIKERYALYFAYILGIYPPFMKHIHQLLTEPVSIFLVCGFLFHFCKLYQEKKNFWTHLIIGSFCLGYLAVTKIFFGYIILIGLVVFLFLYLWKKRVAFKTSFLVYLLAMIFCVPYLFYTYSLTGKIFYWGNSGGLSLYWMSTPYQNEFGDWIAKPKKIIENPQYEKHHEFFKRIEELSYMEKDEELKKRAIQNIINNPSKFIKNWMANIGRLLFNYPYSYTQQKLSTYFFMLPNMFLVVIFVSCIYPAFLGRKSIPFEIYGLLFFGFISFVGSSLLSAYNRQFWPLMPVFLLSISYVVVRFIKIEFHE